MVAKGKGKGKAFPKAALKKIEDDKDCKLSPASLATKKVRENLKDLGEEVTDLSPDPTTKLTLLQQIQADIEAERAGKAKITWGASYYNDLRHTYKKAGAMQKALGAAGSPAKGPSSSGGPAGACAAASAVPAIQPDLMSAIQIHVEKGNNKRWPVESNLDLLNPQP